MVNPPFAPQRDILFSQARVGAGWFKTIAVFSLVNAAINLVGMHIHFVIGLAFTEIIDGAFSPFGVTGKAIGIGIDLMVAGIWWFFAVQAAKPRLWAFFVGMAFYLVDGIIFAFAKDFLAAAFHAYALYRLFLGLQAAMAFNRLPNPVAMPGYPYAQPGAPAGAWPPPPQAQWPQQPQQPGQWPPQQTQQPGHWPPQQTQQPGHWPPQQPQQPGQWPPPAQNPGQPPTETTPPSYQPSDNKPPERLL